MSELAIGVDVGGTKCLAVVVDPTGRVLAESRRPTPHEPGARALVATLVELVVELSERVELDVESVPIGLGLPGMVRPDGRLAFSPHLASATGHDVAAMVGEVLGSRAVHVDNDANCAALCEHTWGAAAGIDDFVMVTLGTGIGGGIVSGGRLVRGHGGFAGEIGHMVVVADGRECACGARGCWEQYASGPALARASHAALALGLLDGLERDARGAVSAEVVTRAAESGHEGAASVVEEVGRWLALGLSNLAAILDSAHFVIGGGLSDSAGVLLAAARTHLDDLVEGGRARPTIAVTTALFGPRSGAMGAGLMAQGVA